MPSLHHRLASSAKYVPRRPDDTVLYGIVREQVCVSAATAAGPAFCHRAGFFLRARREWSEESLLVF